MKAAARHTPRPRSRSAFEVHKWLDLALLISSGAGIMGVALWLQGALTG